MKKLGNRSAAFDKCRDYVFRLPTKQLKRLLKGRVSYWAKLNPDGSIKEIRKIKPK